MSKILTVIATLLFNSVIGATLGIAVGTSPETGAICANVIGAIAGIIGVGEGVLREGVLVELWTGELVKKLRGGLEGSWLDGLPDESSIVNNDIIHLVDAGVEPEVVINNTTYPIPLQALDDQDIAISLDKFQTKVTPITDDELYALSYDKMARVKESHGNAINEAKFRKAAHALCASEHSASTPVLKTSGERDSETGRLRMTIDNLVEMKRAMDKLKVPNEGRRLVLCPDHVNDLLLVSQSFREQYNIDRNTGKVGMLFGFEVYEYVNTPLYTTAGKKKDLGTSGSAGEFNCSFAFYGPRVFKATGSTKMYYSEAAGDPEYQRNKINFRHYFICMPKKSDSGVVMMSGYKAS